MASALEAAGGEDVESDATSLNQRFDEVFQLFQSVNDFEGESTSAQFQKKVQNGIKMCEEITRSVTALDMFSGNEAMDELPTNHIKFLLLPFMLGKLWQLNTEKDRKDVCVASQIYFQDFLQRLFDYGIITTLPPVMQQDPTQKKELNSNDVRAHKIAIHKENKILDGKIRALLDRQKTNQDFDDETARELYLSIIQRSKNESVPELESILKEFEMIEFAAKRKDRSSNSASEEQNDQLAKPPPKNSSGIQTFILTRSDMEKKVFGLGYPALPVMTVDELYAQRRADGTWGPPPGAAQLPPSEEEQADQEAQINEQREESDDPERLQQLRNMDEYKDMHRRGWGNRMNRS